MSEYLIGIVDGAPIEIFTTPVVNFTRRATVVDLTDAQLKEVVRSASRKRYRDTGGVFISLAFDPEKDALAANETAAKDWLFVQSVEGLQKAKAEKEEAEAAAVKAEFDAAVDAAVEARLAEADKE